VLIHNPKDFWSGVIFTAVGLAAVVLARDHAMGTAMRMGPAYLPTTLGILMALIGLALMLRALIRPGLPVGQFALGKLVLVLGSIALFGLLLRRPALVVALIVLVVLSAYASKRFRWPAALALAIGLTAFCVVAFVLLLGLPIPILGTWMRG
jgi:putative tricarboxylic transport membrane protein